MHARMETGKGSALAEFAVLLPVYVLLLVGLIFFSNEILFWQEAQMAARFLATNDRGPAVAPAGTQSPLIAVTSGPAVPQDYFIMGQMQGQPQFVTGSVPGTFSQGDIREELIQASWQVGQSFDLDGGSAISQNLTGMGNVVYGNKPGLYGAIPDAYSFDGDDLLVAQELSNWFNRRSATVTLTHTSKYLQAGKWKLPNATVTGTAEAVVREADCKQRSITASQAGFTKPIEDLLSQFSAAEAPAGSLPMPDYPAFMSSDGFWVPN